jgi:hypothetical protein
VQQLQRDRRTAVQHVSETTMEPCLAGCIVVLGVDRFVVHMREVARVILMLATELARAGSRS